MIFHNYQRVIANEDIPDLKINDKHIERLSCFNFLGLTINEFMNWNTYSAKIANKSESESESAACGTNLSALWKRLKWSVL